MTAENKKISELDAAAALDGTEEVPIVQGADTVRTTTGAIGALATGATGSTGATGATGAGATGATGATGASGGALQSVTVTLLTANILLLNTVPFELVAAPGANKVIVVDHMVLVYYAGVTPFSSTATGLNPYYGTPTDFSVAYNSFSPDVLAQAEDARSDADGFAVSNAWNVLTGYKDKNIVLSAVGGAYTLGNGSAKVTTYYSVLDV